MERCDAGAALSGSKRRLPTIYDGTMTTVVMITFEGELLAKITPGRRLTFDGPVSLPNVGERVANPTTGRDDLHLNGIVIDRQFSYTENHLSVLLTLRDAHDVPPQVHPG